MAAAKSRAKAKQEALAKASAAASTAPVLSQQPPAPAPAPVPPTAPIQGPAPPPPPPTPAAATSAAAAPEPQSPAPTLTAATTAAAPPPSKVELPASSASSPPSPGTGFAPPKTPPRKVLRLKCPSCNDYPDGFRSEHELRRHTNRVHRKTRKVWMTVDTSPDQSFLANCKACQSGKKYNECYNAASHLRRMHFHPHKRGERKMSAAEARRGGKPGDLDPPMEVLKTSWLKEVDEVVGGEDEEMADAEPPTPVAVERPEPAAAAKKVEARAPPTPTTPSTRSMAIESIVDKVDAS
ncbi:uncharacterized protein BDZ99DRAFT_458961 [Mytilinidion resinicola]|uniref:DUF7896 domain-containing protein n=1 Tax=Mytilinidion resinicola TaxID=574789 RepID=A0A6A6Z1N1_9PEZI|nr:uncharacterized protein BDZ99DRAFT_458961 [Mytilinidion resinicola]KAF2815011.1 hypothetical protein BDZ99DRAFT_458961 [Mytilinidion resinicola]